MAKQKHCNLSQEAEEWLNGELLGDGCLQSPNASTYPISRSARFKYGSKYLKYCQYVSDTLNSFGIEQSGKITERYHKDWGNYSYCYNSRCYVELLPTQKKWYPEGKKIVPKDIELTPLVCRQWYIGDGCLVRKKWNRLNITLSTYNFSIPDVEWLVKELNKLKFKTTRKPSNNIIHISSYSTQDFLNYIGECPVICYQYKWSYL